MSGGGGNQGARNPAAHWAAVWQGGGASEVVEVKVEHSASTRRWAGEGRGDAGERRGKRTRKDEHIGCRAEWEGRPSLRDGGRLELPASDGPSGSGCVYPGGASASKGAFLGRG